jgi:hypothetical protein
MHIATRHGVGPSCVSLPAGPWPKPSAVINTAKLLGLHPEPTGEHPDKWRTACPGSNHPIFISADEDRWFCGWCKRKGGPDELESFNRERRRKAS